MSEEVYVFDTGPLRHFALEGWLGVLRFVTEDGRVVIPESVEEEIQAQAGSAPALGQILACSWIQVDRRSDRAFSHAFADFERRLVDSQGRNRGECGVLALGSLSPCTLIIDDRVPRRIAKDRGMKLSGTLGLLCRAIREKRLTVDMVEHLADDLLAGAYRLPFGPGEFRSWAESEGLL